MVDLGDQVECLPMEIYPKRLSLSDYEIKFNANSKKIESVLNKKFGLVEFKSIELGDIGGYMMGSSMKLWSSMYTHKQSKVEMLNIVHIHLNDSSDEVTLEVIYMENS